MPGLGFIFWDARALHLLETVHAPARIDPAIGFGSWVRLWTKECWTPGDPFAPLDTRSLFLIFPLAWAFYKNG